MIDLYTEDIEENILVHILKEDAEFPSILRRDSIDIDDFEVMETEDGLEEWINIYYTVKTLMGIHKSFRFTLTCEDYLIRAREYKIDDIIG